MKRYVIQEYCPFAESIEWELGQRYLQERGNKVFISDPVPVPHAINNDGNLSLMAADLFFTSLIAAERSGTLEEQVVVLEVGVGLGLFARYFLDAFRDLCFKHLKDYYDRLCYVATDRSEAMLVDICRCGVLGNHAGHYRLRKVEGLHPGLDLGSDVSFDDFRDVRFRAVFLNYLLDCLPVAVLEFAESGVQQLCVQTCIARGVDLAEYTTLSREELAYRVASPDANGKVELVELFGLGLFVPEYGYRPVDVRRLPYGDVAAQFARSGTRHLVHNYGAIQCLDHLLGVLHEQGFILINDYDTQLTASDGFEHQRYTGSTFVGVNFLLLKAYFGSANTSRWAEPSEDSPHLVSRLLGRKIEADIVARFQERFSKASFDSLHSRAGAAREYLAQGRFEAAATSYAEALRLQPYNWMLMEEVAKFLTFTLRDPTAGLDMAKAALVLNPTCSSDLWNTLGDSLFCLGRFKEAGEAFTQARVVNPSDVRARYNMTFVLAHERNYAAALKLIAEGLAMDRGGQYREGCLKRQSEIIELLDRRQRQERHLQVDRVSHVARPKDA